MTFTGIAGLKLIGMVSNTDISKCGLASANGVHLRFAISSIILIQYDV